MKLVNIYKSADDASDIHGVAQDEDDDLAQAQRNASKTRWLGTLDLDTNEYTPAPPKVKHYEVEVRLPQPGERFLLASGCPSDQLDTTSLYAENGWKRSVIVREWET